MYPRILKEVTKEIGKPSAKVFDRPLRSIVIPKDLRGTKAIPRFTKEPREDSGDKPSKSHFS